MNEDLRNAEVIDFEIPSTKLLEQMALILRPELNELTLSKQLQLSQCRKAIDDLFSEVRISYENNEDWNRNFYINSFKLLNKSFNVLLLSINIICTALLKIAFILTPLYFSFFFIIS